MMGLVIGTLFGVGILTCATALRNPSRPPSPPRWMRAVHANRRQIALTTIAGCLGGIIAYALIRNAFLALCVAATSGLLPRILTQTRARKARAERAAAWPDALDDMVSALRAGLGIGEALSSLGSRGPSALRPAFAQFGEQIQATGNLEHSLDGLKERLGDPVADRVVEAMRLASALGGYDLANVLQALARNLRAENRDRGELIARQSWAVNGARVAAVAPWVVLALLASRPGTVEAFANPTGTAILVGGFLTTVVAYALMVRLGRLPEEPRVLAGRAE
ncbi:MAG: type II secretion system F family protein [Ancrocorticia sp.]|uniref:type II secretion system F family protein n=1 Tax=Ancrocorticia sp. TaxID=2593684 RepID=UPI003F8E2803